MSCVTAPRSRPFVVTAMSIRRETAWRSITGGDGAMRTSAT